MHKKQLIREALALPPNAIAYHASQILSERFPDKALIEGEDGRFDVEEYAKDGHCRIKPPTPLLRLLHTPVEEDALERIALRLHTSRATSRISGGSPSDEKVLQDHPFVCPQRLSILRNHLPEHLTLHVQTRSHHIPPPPSRSLRRLTCHNDSNICSCLLLSYPTSRFLMSQCTRALF